jgi:hypothetical protein
MSRNEITITQLLTKPAHECLESLWYDWFCRKSSLTNRGKRMLGQLKTISKSTKFDNDKCYVFFTNNLSGTGYLYDEFKICDIETGNVIYSILPTGWANDGYPEVWGVDNNFDEPIFKTESWKELKAWFLK